MAREGQSGWRWALFPAAIMFSFGGALLLTLPAFAVYDEAQHADYAWNLWHGRLPSFDAGVTAPLAADQTFGPQYVDHHPPLAHLLLAPVVGPLLDAGHPIAAIVAGRTAILLVSVLAVLATGWLAHEVKPLDPVAPLSAAIIAAGSAYLALVAIVLFTDAPLVLMTAVALAAAVRILRQGFGTRELLLLVACGALGLAVRAWFVTVIAAAAFAVLLAQQPSRRLWERTVAAGVAGIAPFVITFPWWLRNEAVSGSWVGARPDVAVQIGRVIRDPLDVATDPDFYVRLAGMVWPFQSAPTGSAAPNAGSVVLLTVLGVVLAVAGVRWIRNRPSRVDLAVAVTLAIPVLGSVALLVMHVSGGGANNPRYLLATVPSIAVGLALALPRPTRLPILLPLLLMITGWFAAVGTVGRLLQARRYPDATPWESLVHGVEELGVVNPWVPWTLLITGGITTVIMTAAVGRAAESGGWEPRPGSGDPTPPRRLHHS